MRRLRSLFARALPVAMLASLLAVIGGAPAHADTVPATNWTPATIGSSLPAAGYVVTDPAGGATVGCPAGNSPTQVFTSFSSTGTAVQDQAVGSHIGTFCNGNGTVGKDGTVYVGASSSSGTTQYIQAWKNDSLVWEYTIPCGSYGTPWTMVMGANGNLYLVVYQGGGSCNSTQLIGLTPTAQAGSPPVPGVVMNIPLYVPGIYGQGMSAYNDGLVLYPRNGTIQYVPYSVTSANDLPAPVSVSNITSSYVGAGERWFEAQPDGTVFLPVKATTQQTTTCSDPSSRTGAILTVKPDGTTSSLTLGGCRTVHEMHPTPGSGVAMRYSYSDTTTNGEVERISANGWAKTVGDPDLMTRATMAVDLNGNIAIRNNATPYYNGYLYPEIGFTLLSGVTGEFITSVGFSLRGEHDTTDGPSYMWAGSGDIALAKNTVYVTAYQCNRWNAGCNTANTKLYAFKVPGLQMDYPRGMILGAGAASQSYVAMGDSFSAGQGVPPFTDASGCNRSTQAYSYLLAQSVVRPLSMQNFIACSGATTADVRLGGVTGVNQPKQVDALSTGTKLVTITIGGNDIGFGPLAEKCVESSDCTTSTEYSDALYKVANVLPDALDQAYADIKAKLGSSARVLVVGYPMMIPDPAINTTPNCLYLTHDEKVAARSVIGLLNQAVQDAVARAGSPFEYVDPNGAQSPFIGHELCMDGGYYNGVDVAHPEYSLHPNALGQDAFRWVIEAYLN